MKDALREKQESNKKYLSNPTEHNHEIYKEKRRAAKEISG